LPDNNGNEKLAATLTEISERTTALVKDEIELAKAEMTEKVKSLGRGAVLVAVGAVCGIFVFIFALLTIAWAINDATGDLWLGFLVVLVLLTLVMVFSLLFAWRKFKVGAPKPTMAIDEAKKIRATVSAKSGGGS
jgi:NADH:ubiquinone oxidoreductase subunit 6 (subunit J)